MTTTVGEVGEDGLLALIVPEFARPHSAVLVGNGDDSAVLAAPHGAFTVSTDVLVAGRHFTSQWSTGWDVGYRAAVQNLADAAAMGAKPVALVVALVLPASTEVTWVLDLARGLAAGAARHGASVVGGDLSGGSELVIAVTVHGDLDGRPAVLRSGARPGDVIAHTGLQGYSAAGLALLQAGLADLPGSAVGQTITAFRRPDPPIEQGVNAAIHGATAMLDVSDGLVRDAGRIAAASDVVMELLEPAAAFAAQRPVLMEAAAILGSSLAEAATGTDSAPPRSSSDALVDTWVLTGGEDHGLLATFPPQAALPEGFRAIGQVRAREAGDDALRDRVTIGGLPPRDWGAARGGWDHFRG